MRETINTKMIRMNRVKNTQKLMKKMIRIKKQTLIVDSVSIELF